MAINIDDVRNRLKSLQSQTKKQDSFWKPTPGKHVIRIVPYKFNKENPFIELLFHYNIANKPYLSPSTFDRPDPIVKYADHLKSTGVRDDWKMGKQLEPKLRTFVPIIVRGRENEGVKFWGFGKTVYQELLGLISDQDYGDITDIKSGHDITVEFKSAKETGKNFPSTSILPKPSKTSLVESAEQLRALFDTQVNILDIYKEPTYSELESVLEHWLNGDVSNPETADEDDETVAEYANSTSPATSPATSTPSNTNVVNNSSDMQSSVPTSTLGSIDADLDKLFED